MRDNKGKYRLLGCITASLILLGVGMEGLHAQQDISKEIVVVKPYQPSLSDAFKINTLPTVSDSLEISPDFTYAINPKKYETGFNIEPIKAANIVAQPLSKLTKSYLKLGFGNYITPLAELNVSSLRSKEHSLGVYLKHNSINGKLKLDKDTKIKPGYSDNTVSLYGKKIYRNSSLSGNIRADYLGVNYYGIPDSSTIIPDYADIQQNYFSTGAEIRYKAIHDDTTDLIYDTRINYNYIQDKFNNSQHAISLSGDFVKYINKQTIGLNAGFQHFISSDTRDSASLSILRLNPWIARKTGEYTYLIGAKLAPEIYDGELSMHIYPMARLDISIVKNILGVYLGLNGYLQENDMNRIIGENPYVHPGLRLKSTSHKFIVTGGLNGSLTSKISYDASFNYSLVDDMYFYVNDSVPLLKNHLTAVQDDYEAFRIYGELSYRYSEKLWFHLNQNIYKYNLDTEKHPWHRPLYDLTFSSRYNLRNKILANLDIFYIGQQYARNFNTAGEPYQIAGTLDFNIGAEYRYTDILSVFLRLNHILGSENFMYYQYPTMRFNLMAGFTYSL